jgi:transposase
LCWIKFRNKLTEELGAVKNMMIRWLDRYYPEFTQVFPSFGKNGFAVLEFTLFPSDLHQKQPDEILTHCLRLRGSNPPKGRKHCF